MRIGEQARVMLAFPALPFGMRGGAMDGPALLTFSYADKKHRDALFAEIAKDVSAAPAR